MLIVEIQPLPNGAHRNKSGNFRTIPNGFIAVPRALEVTAQSYLPHIELTIENGVLVGVAQGERPPLEPEPELPASETDMLMLAVVELYENELKLQQENTDIMLAVTELYEMMIGG